MLGFSTSCKKDEDSAAKTTSDAEKMSGTYDVVEYEKETNKTKNYTAKVTVVNDSTINIEDIDYGVKVNYHWTGNIVANLSKKYLIVKGSTVSGTITDERNWQIVYAYGTQSIDYKVTQTFKRK